MITKSETLLTVKDVNLTLGGRKILRDINFEVKNIHRPGVEQGQIVALLGRSGIGKTQLFKILSGLLTPDSGQILINKEQVPVKTGDMGVVFQDYYVYEWRKVKTLLEFAVNKNPLIKQEDKAEAVKEIANQFDIVDHLNKYSNQLSGGQRQRVAIAEQILNGGNFILMDEPFSGLDVIVIDKVINTLLKISTTDELKTLVIVSHDLSNTIAISDTVYILNTEPNLAQGATIVHTIDLIERDLVYQKDIKENPRFRESLKEIKNYMF